MKPRILKIKIYSDNITNYDALNHVLVLSENKWFRAIEKKEHSDCAYEFANGNSAFVRANKTETIIEIMEGSNK